MSLPAAAKAALWVLAALAALSALSATACGIPIDSEPRVLEASAIPPEFLEPTTTQLETPSAVSQTFRVYFVNEEGMLVARERELSRPVAPEELLLALFAGPTDEETEAGLNSALPAETEILDADRSRDGVLVLNLAEGTLEQIEGELQRSAIAQLVFTGTEIEGVDWLWVQIENEPRALPTDEGDLETPVGRQHYLSLVQGEGGRGEG